MDRIGVFTRDFQILYLFETRETLEFNFEELFWRIFIYEETLMILLLFVPMIQLMM